MRARPVVFRSGDLTLEGELVEPDACEWTLVLCHGIPSGAPSDPADEGYAGLARALAARGFAAMWFDFRGARSAPGDFSIAGWCTDLHAALDAVRPLARAPLAVVGSSAGGACAVRVTAEREDVAALVTLAAPATFGGLVDDVQGALHRFRNIGIIRDPGFPEDAGAWASEFADAAPISFAGSVSPRPFLIVHGDADDVVPYPHAEMLFEKAGEPKELVRLPGGLHQLRRDPRALEAVADWFQRRSRPSRPHS